MSETGRSKFQSHVALDFPIKSPASAKALPEELPPLMPDFAKIQDEMGTVHFSRFMVKGDEKLLFLSDVDGEVDDHIKRLVQSAGPVLDAIFKHVEDPPATPVAGNPEKVIKWLRHHIREPIDTYFAYDASVQESRRPRVRRALRQYPAEPLADIHGLQVTCARLCPEAARAGIDRGERASSVDSVGTVHISHFVPFENNHLGFFTIFDGSFEKYIQDFAEKTSFTFNTLFPNVIGAPPTPVEKNAQAFLQWGNGKQLSAHRVLQRLSRPLGSGHRSPARRSQVTIGAAA